MIVILFRSSKKIFCHFCEISLTNFDYYNTIIPIFKLNNEENICLCLVLVFALSIVFTFSSCLEANVEGTGSEEQTSVEKIENLSEYVIVKSEEASKVVSSAASLLCSAVMKRLGEKGIITTDLRSETAYEFVIGKTNRNIEGVDCSSLGFGEFIIKMVGDKVIIAGGSDKATADAVEFFCKEFVSADAVRLPVGEGHRIVNEKIYNSINIDGCSITEYTIVYDLY